MIVTLMDGDTLRTIFTNCTGYRAKRIEFEAKDFWHMRNILDTNPDRLRMILAQLETRLPEGRVPPAPTKPEAVDFLTRNPDGGIMAGVWKVGYQKHSKRNWFTDGRQKDVYEEAAKYIFPNHPVIPRKPLVFDDYGCELSWLERQRPMRWFWVAFAFIFTLFI